MVVALSVFTGNYSGPCLRKRLGFGRIIFFLLLLAECVFYPAYVHAAKPTGMELEAADSFVFDRQNENDLPLALKLSPFTPAPNEYKRFEEMSKDDRRLALGQIAVGLLAQSLDNRVGRTLLAVTDPIKDIGGGLLSCKQRFSTKSYRLRCRMKF